MSAQKPGVRIRVDDRTQVAQARREAGAAATRAGLAPGVRDRVLLVATELATNLVSHAGGGQLVVQPENPNIGPPGLLLLSLDQGPGIASIPAAMRDGWSTAGTPGNGLGAIGRAADHLDVYSLPRAGSVVLARFGDGPAPAAPAGRSVRWAGLAVPRAGEDACGDVIVAGDGHDPFRIAVIDGVGHGPDAAIGAGTAARTVLGHPRVAPAAVLDALATPMRPTRGAVVGIADVHLRARTVQFAGIGNISGRIVTPGKTTGLVSHHGTVGVTTRPGRPHAEQWPEGALLVLHSDGLRTRWDLDAYPGLISRDPAIICGRAAARRGDHHRRRLRRRGPGGAPRTVMSQVLYAATLRSEDDLVATRRRLLWLVEAVGFPLQNQTRLVTGVSSLLTAGLRHGRPTVELSLDRDEEGPGQVLRVTVAQLPDAAFVAADRSARSSRERREAQEILGAVSAVAGIVPRVRQSPESLAVTLEQPLPEATPLGQDRVASILEEVTRIHPGNPFEEIQQQNRELVAALRELHATTIALQDAERGVTALTVEVGDHAQALRAATAANRTMLETLAHEVRGPLYAIRALLDSMIDPTTPFTAAETAADLRQIDRATVEALRLVDAQLDVARARANGVTPIPELVVVADLVSALRGMTAPLCRPGVELVMDATDGPQTLFTDPHLLGQALRNLVGNALKFTDAGEVRVAVVVDPPGTVAFLISDTGIGIAGADLKRIFGDFEVVEGDRLGRLPGTGLGLPLVRRIAHALGGEVSATSIQGSGSTFRLTLPQRPRLH